MNCSTILLPMNQPSDPATPAQSPASTDASLGKLETLCWQRLLSALTQKEDAFKTMVLATYTGQRSDARLVVLRQVDATRKYVWFHTDSRADKVMQLEAFPDAALVFWDEKQQLQLRLSVETRLHTDDYIADEHWQTLWVGSRKMYLSEYSPGNEQPAPYPGFPKELGNELPSAEASEVGRKNFAVIECRVLALEYLQLNRSGQTRARFQYEPESKLVWLAP